jgi:hypothetical protein
MMNAPKAMEPPPLTVDYQAPRRQSGRWSPVIGGILLIVVGLVLLTFVGSLVLYLSVGR